MRLLNLLNLVPCNVGKLWLLSCILLCSPIQATTQDSDAEVNDPIEPVNRFFMAFNQDVLDRFILKPVSHTYKAIVPRELRFGVANVINNLKEPSYAVNHLLVGEWRKSFTSVARFGINSTVGLLGILDVADGAKIYRNKKNFYQVLGHYGIGNGPYLMLPFLGPSTPRNLVSTFVDRWYFPFSIFSDDQRLIYLGANVLNQRVDFIPREHLIHDASDPYLVLRNIYWQSVQVQKYSDPQETFEETIPEEFLDEVQ